MALARRHRTRLGGFLFSRWALAAAMVLAILAIVATGHFSGRVQAQCDPEDGPSVVTNEQIYLPGDIAVIDGCGFNAYEGLNLALNVIEPDQTVVSSTVLISSGQFTTNYTVANQEGLYKVEVWDGANFIISTIFYDDHHFEPAELQFIAIAGGPNPPAQITQFIGPSSCGAGTISDNQSWITTTPSVSFGLGDYVAGPGSAKHLDISVSLSTGSLAVGTYTGTVTVDASVGNCNSAKTATIRLRVIQANPGLTPSCGLDIVLVIDSSGSVSSSELNQMKSAMSSFVSAFLPGTASQMAVVDFDTSAAVTQMFTTNTTSLNNAINATSSGGNTNWDDALFDSRSLFPNRGGIPDLIVFASDGNPNRIGGHTALGHPASVQSANETTSTNYASEEANAAKAAGIRVVTLGIGNDLDVTNLKSISGTTVSPPAPVDENVDVITSSFSTLANDLASLAAGLCSTPTPTATKTNTPTNTPVPPTNTPTNTPVPPTNTATNTAVPPTNTPTSTATNTPVPPTNTATNTPPVGGVTATPGTETATPSDPSMQKLCLPKGVTGNASAGSSLCNLFLTRQGTKIPPLTCAASTDVAVFTETLNIAIPDVPEPKFEDFDGDTIVDRQQLGAFEFEVHFNPDQICVNIVPGAAAIAGGMICIVEDKDSSQLEGVARIGCVTSGKAGPFADTTTKAGRHLADIVVRPQPDLYSIIRPNQDNGAVLQLNNVACELADLQGHPIAVFSCDDADVTIRFLEGDVSPDCVVNALDTQAIAFRWGAQKGHQFFVDFMNLEPSGPQADNDIDVKDLQFIFGRFGSTCKVPWPAQAPVNPKA